MEKGRGDSLGLKILCFVCTGALFGCLFDEMYQTQKDTGRKRDLLLRVGQKEYRVCVDGERIMNV